MKRCIILAVLFGTFAVIRFGIDKPINYDMCGAIPRASYSHPTGVTLKELSAFTQYRKEIAARLDKQLPLATIK